MPRAETASHTVDDVAQRYGVGTATVLTWITGGELAAVNVSRSARSKKPRWRISEAALAAFEVSRCATPQTKIAPRRKRMEGVIKFYLDEVNEKRPPTPTRQGRAKGRPQPPINRTE